ESKPMKCPTSRMCPVDETGMNSVSPSINPSRTTCHVDMITNSSYGAEEVSADGVPIRWLFTLQRCSWSRALKSTSVRIGTPAGKNVRIFRRLNVTDHELAGFCKTNGREMNWKLSRLPHLGHTGIRSRDAVPPTACP